MISEDDDNWFELSDPSDSNDSEERDDQTGCDTRSTCSDSVFRNDPLDVVLDDSSADTHIGYPMKAVFKLNDTVSVGIQTIQPNTLPSTEVKPKQQHIREVGNTQLRMERLHQQICNIRSCTRLRGAAIPELPIDWHSTTVDFKDRYDFVYMLGKRFSTRLLEVDLLDILIHTIANRNVHAIEEKMWLKWCVDDANSFIKFLKQHVGKATRIVERESNVGIFSSAYGMCCVIH